MKLEQLLCVAEGEWAAEWEQAVLGRGGRTLEAKDAFIYRFEAGRIAGIWMLSDAPADSESFWN